MSKAKYPNRDALRDANDIYLDTMRPFIIHHLKQVQGEKVENLIEDALDPGQADKFWEKLDEDDDIESAIDFNYFPQIIQRQWKDAFGQRFNWDLNFQSMLWLIRKGRNSCEHRGKKDLDSEFVRINLFLIADVLGKINRTDKQREVEAIRDELFPDTADFLAEAEKHLKDLGSEKSETEKRLADVQSEKKEYEQTNAALSKEVDEKEKQRKKLDKQLKRAKAQNDKYKKDIAGKNQHLKESEEARDDYKNRFEVESKELKGTKAKLKETEERLAAAQAAEKGIAARLRAVQNLFTVVAIGEQEVQEIFQSVYPPIETDSIVRILDRRDVGKKNYLLELLEQKDPTIIYVQSGEMADLLLERVIPEKADSIEKHGGQTSESEETKILERLENGELIAVVSDTTLSALASSHCIEHFVFCHLVPSLDRFFKQCEPAFTSGKNSYLHLVYNREQDIEGLNQWLVQKYPDAEALGELYRELRKLVETDSDFIKAGNVYDENIYSKLGMAKLGVETGLAIFEELQFLEQNKNGVKFLPDPEKRGLDESKIHCSGEELRQGIVEVQAFQLEQSIEQIWEALLKELNVDNEQILEASGVYEVHAFQDAIEDSGAQSALSTDAVENDSQSDAEVSEAQSDRSTETVDDDNTGDGEDMEAKPAPKPTRANAKATKDQVREIQSRSAAGEANSELAEEDSEKKPEVKQSEFWQPIRAGEFGALFAGKPVPVRDDGWISKRIRGVELILSFRQNRSYVSFLCKGENRIERRDEIIALFPEADYDYSPHESPQRAGFRFPVINKGKDHPEDWDEIRKKLIAMGTDIYNKINESDL